MRREGYPDARPLPETIHRGHRPRHPHRPHGLARIRPRPGRDLGGPDRRGRLGATGSSTSSSCTARPTSRRAGRWAGRAGRPAGPGHDQGAPAQAAVRQPLAPLGPRAARGHAPRRGGAHADRAARESAPEQAGQVAAGSRRRCTETRDDRTPRPRSTRPSSRRPRTWINAAFIRMGTLLGRHAALVWFWDYTNLNSIRALPYVREWHKRYASHGLKVIGGPLPAVRVRPGPRGVEEAAAHVSSPLPDRRRLRLRDLAPVRDGGLAVALPLGPDAAALRHHHFAEGGYRETELAIQMALREIDAGPRAARADAAAAPHRRAGRARRAPHAPPYLEPTAPAARSGRASSSASATPARAPRPCSTASGGVEVLLNGEWINTFELDGPRLYEIVDTGHHQRARADARVRGARDGLRVQLRARPGADSGRRRRCVQTGFGPVTSACVRK